MRTKTFIKLCQELEDFETCESAAGDYQFRADKAEEEVNKLLSKNKLNKEQLLKLEESFDIYRFDFQTTER